MCGRYSLALRKQDLIEAFGPLEAEPGAPDLPRYNIAPGQTAPILVVENDARRLIGARWGVPTRRRQGAAESDLINVRAEGLGRSDLWIRRLRRRRCGVPADGFFEWGTEEGRRVPWHFRRTDDRPFLLAGLWTPGSDGAPPQMAILTTAAGPDVAPLHDRMPVILEGEAVEGWLRADLPSERVPAEWLAPRPAVTLRRYRVSPIVNSGRVDSPECIRPALVQGWLF